MNTSPAEKICPLCGGIVKGSDKLKYYCERCNILFEKEMLSKQGEKEKPVVSVPQKKASLKYIVSKHSRSYHIPGCRYIKQIAKENLALYDNKKDAEKAGYHACICVRKDGA
ncbi:MAG: hypothetical protein ABIF10_03265 [Candidatus Woesearchaeota archaeon]